MRLPLLRGNRSRKSRRLVTGCVVAALLTTAGCAKTEAPAADPTSEATADRVEPLQVIPEPRLPVTVESLDGQQVTVDSVDRLVPLSGSLSEIVFTLGLGDKVVARDITATFEQANDLPVVTRGHDVSAESVLSLRPTLVMADSSTGPAEAMEQIAAAGVPVIVFRPASDLDDIDRRVADVARALGIDDVGELLRERINERMAAAIADIPERAETPRVAFLYLRGSASVYMIGGTDSGATPLIEAVGAIDAGAESGIDGDFVPITSEAMATAAPDVILLMTKGLESVGGVEGLVEIPGIAQTPAGMNERVAVIDDGVLLNYGPRTDQVLRSLAEQIHTDGF
ncbi:heme/hemin ABC transporter substrate-binding protein [Stackebrandtia soli]|uniref:heme/hemin ABC transporter substrate-binding protein n=1 Tax=Stackebrandtia soli TaxID=1892856 RepID=UPI0039ED7C05